MDYIKLKCILNVFNNMLVRRTCIPGREEVTGNGENRSTTSFRKGQQEDYINR
jgi:hypothetical protein